MYSDKLNGFWEEGYHFYFEIRDEKLTVREYRRKITLKTTISYDAESVEKGLKTPIKLEDNVLSYGGSNNPMSWFEEFYYENGEIRLVEGYSFMERKDPYTMKKVEHGPFDHIIIRDEEFHDRLQGEWLKWSISGDYSEEKREKLVIDNDTFYWRMHSGKFHVISYDRNYDRDSVYLVPWDLTEDSFSGVTRFTVYPDMLTTNEMICDMSTPISVFAREENIDKIEVPAGAKAGYTSVMGPGAFHGGPMMLNFADMIQKNGPNSMLADAPDNIFKTMQNNMSMNAQTPEEEEGEKPEFVPCEKEGDDPRLLKKPYKCRNCGQLFEGHLPKFCHECGGVL